MILWLDLPRRARSHWDVLLSLRSLSLSLFSQRPFYLLSCLSQGSLLQPILGSIIILFNRNNYFFSRESMNGLFNMTKGSFPKSLA